MVRGGGLEGRKKEAEGRMPPAWVVVWDGAGMWKAETVGGDESGWSREGRDRRTVAAWSRLTGRESGGDIARHRAACTSNTNHTCSHAMVKRALLVAALDALDTPHHLDPAIAAAAAAAEDALVIVLLSDAFAPTAPRTETWVQVETLLAHVYVQASKAAHRQNNLLLDVSVLLNSVLSAVPPAIDICFRADDSASLLSPPSSPTPAP